MVCPNCKSNDIVAIQGQNYCINCGQRVDVPAPVAVKAAKTAAVGLSVAGLTARKPKAAAAVTQKAPRIKIRTQPKPPSPAPKSSLIINHPTVSAPKISVVSAFKSESVAKIPARSSSKAAPLDLRSDQRKEVLETRKTMLAKPGKAPTRLSDVRRAKPIAARAKSEEPKHEATALETKPEITLGKPELPTKPAPKPAEAPLLDRPKPTPVFAGEGSALVFAWKQLGNWRYLTFALAAAMVSVTTSFVWRLNVDTVSFYKFMESGPAGLIGTDLLNTVAAYGSIWVTGMIIAYLAHVTAANAITHAMAKTSEDRGSKLPSWFKVGLTSLWSVVAIDLTLLPFWAIVLGAEGYLLYSVAYGNMPQLQQLAILITAHSLLIYAALALVFVRLLGGYAVVVGSQPAGKALFMGWKMYRKRSLALTVCGLIGGGISGLIYLPATALNYANRDLSAEVSGLGQLVGAAGFTAILASFTLVFVTAYFFKHYRRSVLAVYGRGNPKYLAGRQVQPLRAKTKLLTGGVLGSITGIGVFGLLNTQQTVPVLESLIRLINP